MPKKVNKKGSPKRKQRKTSPERKLSPKRRGRPRKTSPRRKRRLNPPPKSPKTLGRLAARQLIEQGFDKRDINPFMRRDIVDEINYGYSREPGHRLTLREQIERARGKSSEYVRDRRLVNDEEFDEAMRKIKNYNKLKQAGFGKSANYYAYLKHLVGWNRYSFEPDPKRLLTDSEIDSIIRLKREGFSLLQAEHLSLIGFSKSQLKNAIKLIRAGFEGEWSDFAHKFSDFQIESAIKLKRAGITGHRNHILEYIVSKSTEKSQIDDAIRLKEEGLTNDEIVNTYIELFEDH